MSYLHQRDVINHPETAGVWVRRAWSVDEVPTDELQRAATYDEPLGGSGFTDYVSVARKQCWGNKGAELSAPEIPS